MDKRKFLALTPFVAIGVILVCSWYEMLSVYHYASTIKYIALAFGINMIVYFLKFRYGIILTGIFLVLATINLTPLFVTTVNSSVKIAGIVLPPVDWRVFLLLIYYFIINRSYWKWRK
ncbi:hypothetical protein F0919_01925 [Taibaiella lutea]|uniref:Uncharacterized protein n=1 Tax=Taibaiella lutea TaxID=2608001 RepID=A0A5M6CMM0_9BACT|nr:hypothetical protein [Taibaiella lutea]KAA5536448.1 hypothetical protein F0919_01925 [Taibaiella lutea]